MNPIRLLIQFLKQILNVYIQQWGHRGKVKLHYNCKISSTSEFEGMNILHSNVYFDGLLGKGSYIGDNSRIFAKVGRFTCISANVHVIPGTHPYTYPFATCHPAFFSLRKQCGTTFVDKEYFEELIFSDQPKKYLVSIGNDCWIGYGVSIIQGVVIGDGAMLLTNATITKDVPPYAIVGGTPAKVIRYRYNENDIEFLLNFKWWNREEKWLRTHTNALRDIELLKKLT